MNLLIKNAIIIDSTSSHHEEKKDILIEKGKIKKIGKRITAPQAKIIQVKNLHVSKGWLDLGVQICDPGLEHREDLETIQNAAIKGGYTSIACFPNTYPSIHNKSQVQYIIKNTKNNIVDFYPIGAVTMNCEGKEIAEMYDMKKAGAIAFSDGANTISDNGMMLRALQYVTPFNGVIMNHPHDKKTASSGQMHEGKVSTSLGLKGIPSLSEELMVSRDIDLAEYTDSRVHIHNISTAKSVKLIKEAKKKKIKVTASVAALNLVFDDSELLEFNSNFKVLPPLREKKDVKALIKGIKDGTIDCICSNHTPWNIEAKDLEFPYAEFGAIGLETTFGLLNYYLEKEIPLSLLIEKITDAPRKILELKSSKIEKGEVANLTLFTSDEEFIFEEKMIASKSKNSPLIDQKIKGKIIAVLNNNQFYAS